MAQRDAGQVINQVVILFYPPRISRDTLCEKFKGTYKTVATMLMFPAPAAAPAHVAPITEQKKYNKKLSRFSALAVHPQFIVKCECCNRVLFSSRVERKALDARTFHAIEHNHEADVYVRFSGSRTIKLAGLVSQTGCVVDMSQSG